MTDHPSALVSVPEPMIEAFRDWYALHFGRPIMKGKARKIVGRILSAAPAAPQAAGVGERERPLCVIAFREGKREPELISWKRMPVGEHWLYSEAQNLGFLIDTDDGTEWVDEDPRRCGIPEHFENVRPLTLQVAKDEMLSAWEVRSELEAALRAPSREPEGGARRFRHLARGTTYVEVGEARLQQSGQFGPCEGDAITVYRGEDGQLWARASSEFHDGRFEELPALATREEAPAEAGEIGAEYDAAAHCVTLAECPPGLFLWNGTLGFKSEYGAMEPVGISPHHQLWKVGNRADAYCADSGEYFWGGTSNHDDRAKLLVYPVSADAVAMVASHGPSALRAQPQARSGEGQ